VSNIRALVVDNFEPFRRFVCSTLGRRPGLQVIGEASDGLEAVHKVEELKPDLILLDVGLPKLDGIEASHRTSRVVPDSKILFITQNNNPDFCVHKSSTGRPGLLQKMLDRGTEPDGEKENCSTPLSKPSGLSQ
jgi:DNA-binding NarL/FixJ family response regulator